MNDFAGPDMLNGIDQCWEEWAVMFDPVPRNVDDYDAECQFLEVLLKLEALVDGDENVKLPLPLSDQLGIRQSAPFSLGDGQDFVSGKGLPDSWIDALV